MFDTELYMNEKLIAEIDGIPSVHETMKSPEKDIIILQLSKASFAMFRVVGIRSNGKVLVSDEFGNGAEVVKANFVWDELRMTTPSYKRPRGQIEGRNYRWKNGELTEARAAATLWHAFVNWFAELSFILKMAFIWPHLAIAMFVFDIPSEDIKSRSRGDEILNTIKMIGLYFAILVIPFEVIYLISLFF